MSKLSDSVESTIWFSSAVYQVWLLTYSVTQLSKDGHRRGCRVAQLATFAHQPCAPCVPRSVLRAGGACLQPKTLSTKWLPSQAAPRWTGSLGSGCGRCCRGPACDRPTGGRTCPPWSETDLINVPCFCFYQNIKRGDAIDHRNILHNFHSSERVTSQYLPWHLTWETALILAHGPHIRPHLSLCIPAFYRRLEQGQGPQLSVATQKTTP